MELVRKGAHHIYAMESDSAISYIEQIRDMLPDHPASSMMEGMNILWSNIPITSDSVFRLFRKKMELTIAQASSLDNGKARHPEAIFFELTARGLLAEHYANKGLYMKAIDQAGTAYGLMKKGFKLQEQINEFLFTSGIYNYFRERYPELHPIYKPFIWVFKSGDKELGLDQLEKATQVTVLTRVEAYVYLSYIYLRYEEAPVKSQFYLEELLRLYPNNIYVQCKYLESMASPAYIRKTSPAMIQDLCDQTRPYYQLAGNVFKALRQEWVDEDQVGALESYEKALTIGDALKDSGETYKSLAYLGAGRVYENLGKSETAKKYYQNALDFAESDEVRLEARARLRK